MVSSPRLSRFAAFVVAATLGTVAACASRKPAPAPSPEPDLDCPTYSAGFGSFPDTHGTPGRPALESARRLFAYLKRRPRVKPADREAIARDRALLDHPPAKLEDQVAFFAEYGTLTHECALESVLDGWRTLARDARAFGFDEAEIAAIRAELVAYLRDDDHEVYSLVAALGRLNLADSAARFGFLDVSPTTRKALTALADRGMRDLKRLGNRSFGKTPKPGEEMSTFLTAARDAAALTPHYMDELRSILSRDR